MSSTDHVATPLVQYLTAGRCGLTGHRVPPTVAWEHADGTGSALTKMATAASSATERTRMSQCAHYLSAKVRDITTIVYCYPFLASVVRKMTS